MHEVFTCWLGVVSLGRPTRGEKNHEAERVDLASLRSALEEIARDGSQRVRLGTLVGDAAVGETTPRRLVEEVLDAVRSGRLVATLELRRSVSGPAPERQAVELRELEGRLLPRRARVQPTIDALAEPLCDFDRVNLTFACAGRGERWPRTFDRIVIERRDTVVGSDVPRDEDEHDAVPVLEIIAGEDIEGGRRLRVEVAGDVGYACDRQHPRIVVHPAYGERLERSGDMALDFIARARPWATVRHAVGSIDWLAECHASTGVVNEHHVVVDACGSRVRSETSVGHVAQLVRVFPPDEWTLTLALPATNVVEKRWPSQPPGSKPHALDSQSDDDVDNGGSIEVGVDPLAWFGVDEEDRGWSVTLARERGDTTTTLELHPEWLDASRLLTHALTRWFARAAEPKLQLGPRISFEVEGPSGSLEYAWGFRETATHRVHRWWKLEASVRLFSIKPELSYGFAFKVWGVQIEAVAYASVHLETGFDASAESTAKDVAYEVSRTWEAPIRGGVRALLGADWVSARGELVGGYDTEILARFGDRPLEVALVVKSRGLRATLQGEVKLCGFFATASHAWTIFEPREVWRHPAAEAGSARGGTC